MIHVPMFTGHTVLFSARFTYRFVNSITKPITRSAPKSPHHGIPTTISVRMWGIVTNSECPSVLVSLHEHFMATMPTRTSELYIKEYQSILDPCLRSVSASGPATLGGSMSGNHAQHGRGLFFAFLLHILIDPSHTYLGEVDTT